MLSSHGGPDVRIAPGLPLRLGGQRQFLESCLTGWVPDRVDQQARIDEAANVSNLYRALRRGTFFKAILGREPFHWVRPLAGVEEFGTRYGRWGLNVGALGEHSTVLSFGLGEDLSFEAALMAHFRCRVVGFDPTPRSVAYVAQQSLGPRFRAHAFAISDHDGHLKFRLPPSDAADQVSASAVAGYAQDMTSEIEVPCLTLESARQLAGVERIDVLKLDIEGAEYAVLKQSLARGWLDDVQQLLVEFHHFLPGVGAEQTREAIAALQRAGFVIAWIGRTNHEYAFIRTRISDPAAPAA